MSAEAEAAPAAPAAGAAGDGRAAVRKDVLDLTKYVGQSVRVKMLGGREVQGELRGYDPLVNLVLDECVEYLRDPSDPYKVSSETRHLGLVVCRGTQVSLICPVDGIEEIENPFLTEE